MQLDTRSCSVFMPPSQIGSHIRKTREEAGIGLRELARRIEKSPAFLVALERSEIPPGVTEETLKSIANELNVSIDLLMTLAAKVPLRSDRGRHSKSSSIELSGGCPSSGNEP